MDALLTFPETSGHPFQGLNVSSERRHSRSCLPLRREPVEKIAAELITVQNQAQNAKNGALDSQNGGQKWAPRGFSTS